VRGEASSLSFAHCWSLLRARDRSSQDQLGDRRSQTRNETAVVRSWLPSGPSSWEWLPQFHSVLTDPRCRRPSGSSSCPYPRPVPRYLKSKPSDEHGRSLFTRRTQRIGRGPIANSPLIGPRECRHREGTSIITASMNVGH
jgi:hypothetical protein